MTPTSTRALVGIAAALLVGRAATARAESWCATPLIAHEWGVQLFDAAGAPRPLATLPARFHRQGPAETSTAARVSDLPPDGGLRELPVLHFYAPGNFNEPVPLGLGVGFTQGGATAWFPQVDVRRPADASNSPAARAIRAALEQARAHLHATFPRPTLPDDPTQQLQWNQLRLARQPSTTPPPIAASASGERWIAQARQLPDALWVERGSESERFVFYEAGTRERAAPRVQRTGRTLVIENPTAHPVHDVFVLQREGAARQLAFAPTIAAGGRVTVSLTGSSVEAMRAALRARWVEPNATGARDGKSGCVMNRDPAIPFGMSSGHRLYGGEVDLLLATWAPALFEGAGSTIVYREDPAYLDQVMPLQLFTDMYHHIELRRLGLAVMQNVGP